MRRVRAVLARGLCVITLAACETSIVCGTGTHESEGRCAPDQVACGPGTQLQGDQCISCGGDARYDADAGVCVPTAFGPRYEIRIGASEVPADGYSKIPVNVLGTSGSGDPIVGESVALGVERSDQGRLEPGTVTLGPLGAQVWFTPCSSSADAGCLGPARLTASNQGGLVARSALFTLVAPQGVGSPAPCLVGGNVLFLDGEQGDPIHPGTATIQLGTWSGFGSAASAVIRVVPSDLAQGQWWDTLFSSQGLGLPLTAQVYGDAVRPGIIPGHPWMEISGDGRGCGALTGRFQVFAFALDAGPAQPVHSFTATFEQSCDGNPILRGCVHYEE